MPSKFHGKNALITGGSSGIGLALAKKLAVQGANVWILARDQARLESACQEINALRVDPHQQIDSLAVDVSQAGQVFPALEGFSRQFGGPDLLINCAGVTRPGKFAEMDLSIFRAMMEVNYFGTLYTIKAALPGMIQRGSGHIVNISSLAGMFGVYGYSSYGPSKFAVRSLTDTLRYELAEHNIRMSVVFPPDTQTPQYEAEGPYKPPVLVVLDKANKVLSADAVADTILNGVTRGKYVITPGFDSTVYFHLTNFFGLVYPVMDFMVAQAHRVVRRGGSSGRGRGKDHR